MSIVKTVSIAADEHVPKLVRLLGTPAPEGATVDQQRTNMVAWLEKRRIDDHKSVVENHPYEQVVPPEHVLKHEQCFGRYFSAVAPYCTEKCAFALRCVETLQKSVNSILNNGSSLTEAKEGLTKQERKKQMAKEIKNMSKAPVKTKNPEPELEEEEPTLLDEDEVLDEEEDEAPAPKKKASAPAKKAPEPEEEDEEAEEEDEVLEEEAPEEADEEPAPVKKAAPAKKKAPEPEPEEDEEAEEEDPAEEEEPEEEDEEEEPAPAPKKKVAAPPPAPKKATPPPPPPAPKKAAPAATTEKLAKKVPVFAPFGADVMIKLTVTDNPLKASDSAFDLVNEALALAGTEGRITQQQLFDCISKIFIVGDDAEEKENVLKGIAEELKDKGVLKLVRLKTA